MSSDCFSHSDTSTAEDLLSVCLSSSRSSEKSVTGSHCVEVGAQGCSSSPALCPLIWTSKCTSTCLTSVSDAFTVNSDASETIGTQGRVIETARGPEEEWANSATLDTQYNTVNGLWDLHAHHDSAFNNIPCLTPEKNTLRHLHWQHSVAKCLPSHLSCLPVFYPANPQLDLSHPP